MPDARNRIIAELGDECGYYSPSHRSRVAARLMEIVRDAYYQGFEAAIRTLDEADYQPGFARATELLREAKGELR
jgi:hypothetical protein